MLKYVIAGIFAAGGAWAQVNNIEADGNLAPTYDVACQPTDALRDDYSPADLAGAVVACFTDGQDDLAVDMFLVMQMRGVYDSLRVIDQSAHQAGRVLQIEMAQTAGAEWEPRMRAAFDRFGPTGGARHAALCKQMEAKGPPTHSPRYMVQHGIKAFSGQDGDGLDPDFDAEVSWERVLDEFMDCYG